MIHKLELILGSTGQHTLSNAMIKRLETGHSPLSAVCILMSDWPATDSTESWQLSFVFSTWSSRSLISLSLASIWHRKAFTVTQMIERKYMTSRDYMLKACQGFLNKVLLCRGSFVHRIVSYAHPHTVNCCKKFSCKVDDHACRNFRFP